MAFPIIKGTLYLEGLNQPITLELEGNCNPDLAERHLTFRNLMQFPGENLDGLNPVQCGEAGTMTANRMVRIPMISREDGTMPEGEKTGSDPLVRVAPPRVVRPQWPGAD